MDITVNRNVDYSLGNKVQVVLNMLDEATEEYESGAFIEEDVLFQELENIQ